MAQANGKDDRAQVNVAGTFRKRKMDNYDKSRVSGYIETMLEDKDILHGTVLMIDPGEEKATIQTRLHKAAVSKTAMDTIADIYEAMEGHIETWMLTESTMHHPEIYK